MNVLVTTIVCMASDRSLSFTEGGNKDGAFRSVFDLFFIEFMDGRCVKPVPLSDCEQELAQKIKGYQEQIASLNSKCKMVSVKAKHATMLLTVTDVEGLPVGLDHLDEDRAQKAPSVTVTEQEPHQRWINPSLFQTSSIVG
jgi:hypothetical protein